MSSSDVHWEDEEDDDDGDDDDEEDELDELVKQVGEWRFNFFNFLYAICEQALIISFPASGFNCLRYGDIMSCALWGRKKNMLIHNIFMWPIRGGVRGGVSDEYFAVNFN